MRFSDHQLNYSSGGASLIVVHPKGKSARFVLTIGLFNQEGGIDSLSSVEIDATVKRVDELKATRASPFSASVLKFYRFIPDPVFLLHIDSLPCRCEKVKDCGTTTGHVGLDARTLMKDARGGLIR